MKNLIWWYLPKLWCIHLPPAVWSTGWPPDSSKQHICREPVMEGATSGLRVTYKPRPPYRRRKKTWREVNWLPASSFFFYSPVGQLYYYYIAVPNEISIKQPESPVKPCKYLKQRWIRSTCNSQTTPTNRTRNVGYAGSIFCLNTVEKFCLDSAFEVRFIIK